MIGLPRTMLQGFAGAGALENADPRSPCRSESPGALSIWRHGDLAWICSRRITRDRLPPGPDRQGTPGTLTVEQAPRVFLMPGAAVRSPGYF